MKNKHKKESKDKLLLEKQRLERAIAGCLGCRECNDAHAKLKEIKLKLGADP